MHGIERIWHLVHKFPDPRVKNSSSNPLLTPDMACDLGGGLDIDRCIKAKTDSFACFSLTVPDGNSVVFSEHASCVCLLYCIAGESKAVQKKKKWHQSYTKIEFLNPNVY